MLMHLLLTLRLFWQHSSPLSQPQFCLSNQDQMMQFHNKMKFSNQIISSLTTGIKYNSLNTYKVQLCARTFHPWLINHIELSICMSFLFRDNDFQLYCFKREKTKYSRHVFYLGSKTYFHVILISFFFKIFHMYKFEGTL